MSFIPEDELKGRNAINLAPMIDFLFLMLMFFATLAISRVTTKDTEIELVELKAETKASSVQADSDVKIVNIAINAKGEYKWVTEMRDYPLENAQEIAKELMTQYNKGILPEEKEKTHVLLKIDKNAVWEPILKAVFAIKDAGFSVHPVYEPETV